MKKLYAKIKWECISYMAVNDTTEADIVRTLEQWSVVALVVVLGLMMAYGAIMWLGSVM